MLACVMCGREHSVHEKAFKDDSCRLASGVEPPFLLFAKGTVTKEEIDTERSKYWPPQAWR